MTLSQLSPCSIDSDSKPSSLVEGLLCTALLERNKVIVLLDIEVLLAQRQSKEDLYQTLCSEIHSINAVIERSGQSFGHELIDPVAGNVAFCSLSRGWAISIPTFAACYREKFGIPAEVLAGRLWVGLVISTCFCLLVG
jgi:U5 small nuclear ribonucleoprotein component